MASGDTDEGRDVSMASDGAKVPLGDVPDKENQYDQDWGFVAL